MNVTSQMPVDDKAETKTSGQWPFMGTIKNSVLFPKLGGGDADRQHRHAGRQHLRAGSFNLSWRQTLPSSHSPLCKVAAASSCYFSISPGSGTHLISQACSSPSAATQHLPTVVFNTVSMVSGHWIILFTTSLQAIAKHPSHRFFHIKKTLSSNLRAFLQFEATSYILVTPNVSTEK